MKSNICWSTKYYVQIKGYEICAVYNNENKSAPWEVYIQTDGDMQLQLLIDALEKGGVKFLVAENRIILRVKSLPEDVTFIGGYLPPIYEELLERLETVVYEILRDTKEEN